MKVGRRRISDQEKRMSCVFVMKNEKQYQFQEHSGKLQYELFSGALGIDFSVKSPNPAAFDDREL